MVTTDVQHVHRRSVEAWLRVVDGVEPDRWDRQTPCTDWDARALTNHLVGEDLWTAPILAGRTIAEVGDAFEGDLLGDDPAGAARAAAEEALRAAAEAGVPDRTVHLSYGDERAGEYLWQLSADHLVHAWDLAVATGRPSGFEPDLAEAILDWFSDREEAYRSGGAIGPRVEVGADATPLERLLGAFGRDPNWVAPEQRARP